MKFNRSAFALLALLILAVACKQPPTPPRPSDTARAGGGSTLAPDWISPSDIRGVSRNDLPPLRSDTNAAASNRKEGLFPAIYFDFDQSAVRPSDRPALQEAADYLLRETGAKLVIEGHCDWRGTTEYNMALGERRAASARDYLLSLGISPDRVEIVSKGDLEAIQVDDEAQLQQDRRADLVVIPN